MRECDEHSSRYWRSVDTKTVKGTKETALKCVARRKSGNFSADGDIKNS